MKEFINGDCMEGMKDTPDNFYDLAIVDPPYGIGQDGRNDHTKTNLAKASDYRSYSRYDKYKPDQNYFQELFRVSKNQIIWGANHFGNMPASPCWIIWDKKRSGNYADCELAYTSFDTAAKKFEYRWNGMIQEDMKNKEIRQHPNQKPVQLYKWLLINYAEPHFKMLSTYVGSASDLIAFEDFGCDYVGYEIDKDYYNAALKRLNEHKAQFRFFK